MKARARTTSRWFLPAATSLLLGAAALPASAEQHATMQEMRRELDDRDATIRDLQQRVAQLERAWTTSGGNLPQQVSASASSRQGKAATAQPEVLRVDKAAAERALERSLTQNGALLLPAGLAELQFSARYERSERSLPTLLLQGGQASVGSVELRRNDYAASVMMRVGMPFDSQLELALPYRSIHQSLVEPLGVGTSVEAKTRMSAAEDVTVGIAKTFHRESDWSPDIIGRLSWNAGNGSAAMGGGYHRVRGGITLLKRQDPLVFTGNLYVETVSERDGIKPGDQAGLAIAALLAASPETSLSVGIDQVFSRRTRVDGVGVAGTNQVSSMLMLGATTSISRYSLLSWSLGVGLTQGAPDYTFGVSVPVRFQLFK